MTIPLLTTKLHIPPLRSRRVRRSRLVDRLNQGLHRKLTLVSAPAGFGKTTLLAEWIHGLRATGSPAVKVAWLSLDSGDNDPMRFMTYLSAAIEGVGPGVDSGEGPPSEWAGTYTLEPYLVGLINRAGATPDQTLLVLDDYHLITSQALHHGLSFLLDHLPGNMHLVLATRGDPALPLARLRARDDLTELRQSDLRFTPEEVTTFLNEVAGLDLAPGQIASLEARTEGWIAGLRMASLAVEGWKRDSAGGLSGAIQHFTGSHRFILDYLVEEVLEQQPPAVQTFLLVTSVLERLCDPLCDAVRFGTAEAPSSSAEHALRLGPSEAPSVFAEPLEASLPEFDDRSPSQQILEYLENANLFIVPLDDERQWYRYHRLFSDLLRKRLGQVHGDLALTLHRRASEWHEQEGMAAPAIDHALAARDHDRAATLIEESVEATFARSEITTILRWVEGLPADLMPRHPSLCFFHAWALLVSGRSLQAVEQRLRDVPDEGDDDAPSQEMAGRARALRAYGLLLQGDMPRAAEVSAQALAVLPERDRFVRSIMTWVLSLARLFDPALPKGGLLEGSQDLGAVARMGQELGNPLVTVTALCFQARLQARRGRLHQAHEILERALKLATDGRGQRLPIASEALIGLGDLWREWDDFEVAVAYLSEGIELAQRWSEVAAFDAYGPLSRIRAAQGDWQGAWEAIQIAERYAQRSEATDVDDQVAALHHGRLLVAQGDVEGAAIWAERRGLLPGVPSVPAQGPEQPPPFIQGRLRKYELEVLARLFLLQSRAADALDLLEPLLAEARQLGRVDLIINHQVLRALAFRSRGEELEAMAALAEALKLAQRGGHVRVFLDEGPAMASLLRRAAARGVSPAYVERLLAGFGEAASGLSQADPRPQPLIEALSEREMEVLRLLAAGMSNPEIAESLFIAVSTVRSHCKSIYAKLDVHRRWDAVLRAQELGLL